MNDIILDELKKRFRYDPETGYFYHLLRADGRSNAAFAGRRAGRIVSNGYAQLKFLGKDFSAHRSAWAMHYGVWPLGTIDHIDGDRANNKISNLREATQSQNNANMGKRAGTSSRFKGVTRHPSGKWLAQIKSPDGKRYLGYFTSEDAAASAYISAAKKYFGSFARAAEYTEPQP